MRATERERHTEREREDVLLLHSCTCVLALQQDTIYVNEMCVYILQFLKQSPLLTPRVTVWTGAAAVVFVSAALRPLVRPAAAAAAAGASSELGDQSSPWRPQSILLTISPLKKTKKNKPKNKSLRLLFQLRDTLTRVDPEALLLHCGFTCCHQNFSSNWFELFHDSRPFFFFFFGQILLCTLGAINWNNVTFLGVFF